MVTTRSKSLSAVKHVKIPTDSYAWIKYGQKQVKGPEGSRCYFKCKYSACRAKKVEFRDQFNSVIEVVFKGQHKHDPPTRAGKVLSTAESLKRNSIPTHGLKDYPIEVVHIDDSTTVIAETSLNKSPGVRFPFSSTRSPAMPATPMADADVAAADRKVTTRSKSLSASKPIKIPTDSYAWIKYGHNKVKSPEGSRRYFICKYSACQAKKVESYDIFNCVTKVVYKGQHKHDPPKTAGKELSTAKSLKRNSVPTLGLKEYPIEVVHIDGSTTVIAETSLNKSPGVKVRSSLKRSPVMPATPMANADVAAADRKVTTRSKSLSASKPIKIPTDRYAWIRYGSKRQVKNSEGFRSYYKCKYNACHAKKVLLCDQFNSVIEVVYKGQHKHDPPKIVISKGVKVLSTAESLKRKSILTHGLKKHPTEVVHIDDSTAVTAQTSLNRSLGVSVRSSASKPVKTPTDSYAWIRYGSKRQVKSPEGFRSYFKCKYNACHAKKVLLCDQFNSVIEVVYKGQHKHDPPKIVISTGGKVLSTAKSLKGKSISTDGLKEHPIEVGHIDGSEIKQRLKRNSSESSVFEHPKKPKFIVHAAAGTKVSSDGYKWRKYRQKMVKGNPHPRNCYKCTVAGCTVKKHMETVVDGSSQVIITYKGLHNHDIPAGSPQSKKRGYSSTTEAARTNKSARTL